VFITYTLGCIPVRFGSCIILVEGAQQRNEERWVGQCGCGEGQYIPLEG